VIDGQQPLIESRLRELGVARRAAVTLPLNIAALAALPGTNLVATLNGRLVDRYVDDPALAVVAAPVELEPFPYFMFWHPRLDHDPSQQWLRDTVRSVAAATLDDPGGGPGHRPVTTLARHTTKSAILAPH
jgi:DNA-binding transcriptional LysR family regulator